MPADARPCSALDRLLAEAAERALEPVQSWLLALAAGDRAEGPPTPESTD